jgi:EAL domain-containing protein (putative c-di-GMP-specific phosphodiesterase class I)
MRWEDRLIGAVGLGTCSEETAAWLSERLPMVREFGVVAAGLLGPALAARELRAQVRQELQGVIDQEAFRPVFQVVKELATGRIIGFEALTRFADGTPPDLKFNEAVAAGLGLELEHACLTASIRAATALPPGAWLSLNVSPALALAVEPLVVLLRTTNRAIVLEITEHAPIEDYPRLADALVTLRHHARLAVDDAGAGYAGLRHILEVQPQFVKLDISLVRAVDQDAARRAMIGGMIAFARDAGCALIAEGIETPGELATLQELGVRFGQGYLLGRPAPVEAIDPARRGRRLSPASAGLPRG